MKTVSILVYLLQQLVTSSSFHQIKSTSTPHTPTQSHAYTSHYLSLQGGHGLQLPISRPRQAQFDFTLQFAFKATQLNSDHQIIFDMPEGPRCSISNLNVECNTENRIALKSMPDPNAWIQLTYFGNSRNQSSQLRLDQPDVTLSDQGTYKQIVTDQVYIGINAELTAERGFIGEIREFYLYAGQVDPDSVQILAHNMKQFEGPVMAYFQFDPNIGILSDSFRDLSGFVVKSSPLVNNPILYIDEGSKLVCDPLDMNILQDLPTFTKDSKSEKVKIPGFQFSQSQYQYTMSLWIRSDGSHPYSTKELEGISSKHFVLVENVFALWFDSPTSFRVYIFAAKDYLEESTPALSFPLHQWVNIQMQVDQKEGLKVAVYSQSGEQIRILSLPAASLAQQVPSGNIQLFQNFRGQASQFKLWLRSLSLPIPWEPQQAALVDLDFNSENYDGRKFQTQNSFTLPASGLQFSYQKVPSNVDFKNPSTLGHFNSNKTLWDGTGCNSTQHNLVLLDQGPISSQFQMVATKAMTVEFWFKFKDLPTNQTFNLHSLQATNKWSLTVFVEDGVLKCAPFGKSGAEILVYRNISQEHRWQHVSCGFTQQLQVVGQYLAYNTSQRDIMPETYSLPLLSSSQRSPNYLIDMDFTSQLGSINHACYFRDVRVWSHMVSPTDLFTHRFRQLNSMSQAGLELNYKLVDGDPNIVNESKKSNRMTTGTVSVELFHQDLVLCTSDRYFWSNTAKCYQTPYLDKLPLTYTAQMTEQHGLQVLITDKYRQSNLLLPSNQPQVTQVWMIDDSAVYKTSVSPQATSKELVINPFTLGDGYKYEISQLKLAKDNTFWSNQTQVFYPRKCHYLVDTETQQSFTTVTTSSSVSKLCLNFEILKVDGCYGDFYNQLRQEVTIDSSPNIPLLQDRTEFTINTSTNQVKACLPSALLQSLDTNTPLNLVMSVYWSTDRVTTQSWSYINTVYQLIVVDQINANLEASTLRVDIEETVVLDASASVFSQSGSRHGLYYRWVCPAQFQDLCDQFEGSPVMEITPEAFKSYGGASITSYSFKVEIHSLKSGPVPISPDQVFSAQVNLVWATFAAPIFDIIVPLLKGQTVPKVVSSQDVSLTVDIKNYRASDPRLSYKWNLTPQPQNNLFNQSLDGSVFTLLEGALRPDTFYSLEVVISNTLQGDTSTGFNFLNFTTGTPPVKGNLFVTPGAGTMFETNFVIMVNNWQSVVGGGLKINVWGVTQEEPRQVIQIGPSMQDLPAEGLTLPPYSLPLIEAVQVDVFDLTGEKTTLNKTLSVVKPSKYTSWLSVTYDIINRYNEDDLLEQKYLYFAFVAQNCNNDFNADQVDASDCLDAISNMLRQATIDVLPIAQDDSSAKAAFIASSVLTMLREVSSYPATMNSTVSDWTITLLQSIQGKVYVFEAAMGDPAFRVDFLETIGNLIVYETSVITPLQQGRRLESDSQGVINALVVLKNAVLDQMCKSPSSQSIEATSIYLLTEQYSVHDDRKDLQIQNRLEKTIISIPIDELLRTSKDYAAEASSVCLQITFMAHNPVPKYQFEDQEVLDVTFVQVASLDNIGNRVLMSNGLSDLEMNPVLIYTPIDFLSPSFKQNQTVCMAYNANGRPSRWVDNQCQTNYTSVGVYCQCTKLNNYYYGIVNDYTREVVEEARFQFQFTWPFLIIVLLMLLGILLPCFAMYLDRQDKQAIEYQNKYAVSDDLIQLLVERRHYSCHQVVYYKLKDIEAMQQFKAFGWWQAYKLISGNIHPIRSFFKKFDYKLTRLLRVSILMLQVSLISMIVVAVYARDQLDNNVVPYMVVTIFGFFCLPAPETVLYLIKSELNVAAQSSTPEPEVTIVQNCAFLKYILVAFSLLAYALSILIMGLFMMGAIGDKYTFRVSEDNAYVMLLIWLATLAWGFLVLNGLRVILVTVLASWRARQIKSAEVRNSNSKKTTVDAVNILIEAIGQFQNKQKQPSEQQLQTTEESSCLYWVIPYEAVELCLDAMHTIEIVELLKTKPASKPSVSDQTQDQLFETNNKQPPQENLNTSQISAELTDLSNRSHYVRSKIPSSEPVKLQQAEKEEIMSDLDLENDLKSDTEDNIDYKASKRKRVQDEYDLYGLPESARPDLENDRKTASPVSNPQIRVPMPYMNPGNQYEPEKVKKEKKHKKHKKHKKSRREDSD